jgi:arylsulfatase A-like enzyme
MSHQPHELVGIYATEWLLIGSFGLLVSAVLALLDTVAAKSKWQAPPGWVCRIGFAIVVALVLLFGTIAWVTALQHLPPPSLRPWVGLLCVGVLGVGFMAGRGKLSDELTTLARVGRFLSLAGAVSLLSLPFDIGFSAIPAASAQGHAVTSSASRPNIVLISIDALSASHLTPYGYARQTSPRIADFAAHAVVFDQFHSSSNFTTASVASILTGVAPWTHRVLGQAGRADAQFVRESIPALLHANGYTTAYFGSNPWAGARFQGVGKYFNHKDADMDWVFGPCLDQFSEVLPYLCEAATSRLISYSYSAAEHAASALGLISLDPHSDVAAMAARIKLWCDTEGKEKSPVFLWVHLFPPHDPYSAPKPWLGMFDQSSRALTPANSHPAVQFDAAFESPARLAVLEARYDESIAYVDHYVGELLATVQRDLGPNTVIVLTADHGESFNHGYGAHSGVMLYEDLIHIPLIISFPGGQTQQRRKELASQIDIAPTLAELAGVSPSPNWEGKSLVAPSAAPNEIIFAANFEENSYHKALSTGAVAVLRENWKLVRFLGDPRYPNMPLLQDQLFDLRKDPLEHDNLISRHHDVEAALSAEIDKQIALHGGAVGG